MAFGVSSFAGEMLADRHIAKGVNCSGCHGGQKPNPGDKVKTEQCQTCHGSYEKLAEITADKDINMHDTHLGEMDCHQCHKAHSKPGALLCVECHSSDFVKGISIP